MKVAIMQPYFLPYIGYFQLIGSVDCFIIYDNIQYTKKGWINRNRFLKDGKDTLFTIPVKNDSDFLDVKERLVAPDFKRERLLNQIREAYRRSPYFDQAFPLFEKIILDPEANLFNFLLNAVRSVCIYLSIDSRIAVSSQLPVDHSLRGQDKVIALCKCAGASVYINPIGGQELYSRQVFHDQGIELKFLRPKAVEYKQFDHEFVPWLSILDVMMFNSKDKIRDLLSGGFDLI